jgi:hypothetical protein
MLNLSKTRNFTIITTQAIQRVPYTKIEGFNTTQNNSLYAFHKELLTIAMNENNSREVLRIWNAYTNEYTDTFGIFNRVNIDDNIENAVLRHKAYERELVYIHNHPSTRGFSGADLRVFLFDATIGVMTVVTNTGQVYYVAKKERYNAQNADKLYNDIKSELLANGTYTEEISFKLFLKKCGKAGVIYEKHK